MERKSLRILYSSNAPWAASGYGVQGKSLLPRLAELPTINGRHNIGVFAWYGLQGGIHHVDGFRIYPAGRDAYGNDIVGAHVRHFEADVLISLIDVWVMQDTANKIKPALWCPWLPIDHDPVPEKVLESLQGAYLPLTYSKWGHELLKKAGIENRYIPHGIEPGVFRVLQGRRSQVEDFRRQFGLDNRNGLPHLTVMVAANKGYPDRKAFQVQVRAWAQFAADKPDARLYIHTEPTNMYGGLELAKLCANLGVADRVIFPDRYQYFLGMPAEMLALLYNAADVFLGASMSEGFGIPIIEAQACGTPVIVTDFSSMPELVRWGYKVPPRDMFWTPMNSWQAWPDVEGIREALELLWDEWRMDGAPSSEWPLSKRLKVSQQIHDEFSWDAIVRDQWAPLMTELADAVGLGQYSTPMEVESDFPTVREVKAPENGRRPEGVSV